MFLHCWDGPFLRNQEFKCMTYMECVQRYSTYGTCTWERYIYVDIYGALVRESASPRGKLHKYTFNNVNVPRVTWLDGPLHVVSVAIGSDIMVHLT